MSRVLKVNGKSHIVDAPADMPLLWVLRDVVGLTGTKFGCGQGMCGACTVQLDGVPVRSCQTFVEDAEGYDIRTVENAEDGALKAVQLAWEEEAVAQCGYCQAGQMMSAAALVAENSAPTDEDIDSAMSGNICRCGTYGRIRCAIKKAAKRFQGNDRGQ